jgi:hypothetical protein
MIREEYDITSKAMKKLLDQLYHPSIENAQVREKYIEKIRAGMTVTQTDTGEIVSYDDLDLSFLDDV